MLSLLTFPPGFLTLLVVTSRLQLKGLKSVGWCQYRISMECFSPVLPVQFEVETTGIADRSSSTVSSPETRLLSPTVGTGGPGHNKPALPSPLHALCLHQPALRLWRLAGREVLHGGGGGGRGGVVVELSCLWGRQWVEGDEAGGERGRLGESLLPQPLRQPAGLPGLPDLPDLPPLLAERVQHHRQLQLSLGVSVPLHLNLSR